jgi:hypothetical protein
MIYHWKQYAIYPLCHHAGRSALNNHDVYSRIPAAIAIFRMLSYDIGHPALPVGGHSEMDEQVEVGASVDRL